jgi:ScaI restriction endonuclease
MSEIRSPYRSVPTAKWDEVTRSLIAAHPLKLPELVKVVRKVWADILNSAIGSKPFRIGVDIHPKPQIMGFFLHELIPAEFAFRYLKLWRGEKSSADKDLVYIPDPAYSVEIKASSNATKIFGNRSYAQAATRKKKTKEGYYLAINFEKFGKLGIVPVITRIRFGWLDHDDWTGQKAETWQQASLSQEAEKYKLIQLYG